MTVPFLVVAPPASPLQVTLLSNVSYEGENISELTEGASSDWATMLAAMLGIQPAIQTNIQPLPETSQLGLAATEGNVSFLTAYISQTLPANSDSASANAPTPLAHKQLGAEDVPFLIVTPQNVSMPAPQALVQAPALDALVDKNTLASMVAPVSEDAPIVVTTAPPMPLGVSAPVAMSAPIVETSTQPVLHPVAPTLPAVAHDQEAAPTVIDAAQPVGTPKAPEPVNLTNDATPALPEEPVAPAPAPSIQIMAEKPAQSAHAAIVIKVMQPQEKPVTIVLKANEPVAEAPESEEGLVSVVNSARMKNGSAEEIVTIVNENIDAILSEETIDLEVPTDKNLMKSSASSINDMSPGLTNSLHSASSHALSLRPFLHSVHTLPATMQMAAAVQQLVDNKDGGANASGEKSITIQLDPPDLGRVHVKLKQDAEDRLYVHVVAERPETLALLQRDSQLLEMSLGRQNLSSSMANLEFSLDHNGSLFQDDADGKSGHEGSKNQAAVAEVAVSEAGPSVYIDPITGLPRYDMLV